MHTRYKLYAAARVVVYMEAAETHERRASQLLDMQRVVFVGEPCCRVVEMMFQYYVCVDTYDVPGRVGKDALRDACIENEFYSIHIE